MNPDRETRSAEMPSLRFLAEAVPEKISIVRADGEVEFVNGLWLEYLGLSARELQAARWNQFTHPQDVALTLEAWQGAMTLTARTVTFERRIRRQDGTYRWHLSRVRALVNGDRPPVMWIGIDTDIDDQKIAASSLEASVTTRTLELKEMIGQMEAFSYTMAHDLRGPLRTMQGYAQILTEDYGKTLDLAARNYLNLISVAARRMHKLVTDVLTYTRIVAEAPPVIPVALEAVIGSLVIEFPALLSALRVQGELPAVWGDPAALNRVFANLFSNALKFVAADTPPILELFALSDGEWTTVYLADNGIGIPERERERIFRMFERIPASNINEGAGIGLAIVEKTVARMGGMVGVDSNCGRGSTFWVKLRRYQLPNG